MRKFLCSFYPVKPYASFLCVEISDEMGEDAESLYEEYLMAKVSRTSINKNSLIGYNNCWLMLIEAGSIYEAINEFYRKLKNMPDSKE